MTNEWDLLPGHVVNKHPLLQVSRNVEDTDHTVSRCDLHEGERRLTWLSSLSPVAIIRT
jgi:hypothetical protein